MNNIIKDFGLFARDCNVPTTTLESYAKKNNARIIDSYIEPTIIEERTLNATQISVFSRLFMERILFLGDEIDSTVANIINAQLLYLESTNPQKDVTLYINSPGGCVTSGLSIYDVMKFIKCDIRTTCIGMAASMGAVLLSSGTKGKRDSLQHSSIMIHQPLTGSGMVQATDFEIKYKELEKCKSILYNILSENTGKSVQEITDACDRDKWFTATEAVEFGLIDNVIQSKK